MVDFTFLGTGNAFNMGARNSSCYLIQGSKNILLDAGPQVLPALHKHGIPPSQIDMIVISHLHPDHMGGLSFMMLDDKWITKRKTPIKVIVPKGGPDLIKEICSVYYSEEEVEHIPSVYEYHTFEVGDKMEIDGIELEAFEAKHSAEPKMVRISLDGVSIGYSGDSAYHEESLLKILDADLTIHECSSYDLEIPNHVNYIEFETHVRDLIDKGFIDNNKKIYLSHIDDSLEQNSARVVNPFILSYDSMRLKI